MANSYDLNGKTAVVTGGAKSIGRAIAECLAASGARVWIWDANPVTFPGFSSSIVDVTQPDQVTKALQQIIDSGQRIDILVNCAGYLGQSHPFETHDSNDWHQIIDVNRVGSLIVSQAVIPHMRRWRGGRIINMGSLAGKEGLPNLAAYSAASAGVIAFTKALGREVVGSQIFVNCVAPGPIDTDMIRGLGTDAVNGMINDSPMKRLGTREEVAHLVAWLSSEASRFNAGAVFDMSGGRARY